MLSKITKASLIACTALASTLPLSTLADQSAVGDDGREILLKDNGSWEYKNEDRFATSESGSRVRLKDDGSWAFIQNKRVASHQVYSESNLNFALGEVVINTKKSPIPNSNNSRIDSRTEIDFKVTVSEVSQSPIKADISNKNLFSVSDDHDNEYDILSITPMKSTLQPGQTYTFTIVTDGAPKYKLFALGGQIKTLTITADKSVFNTQTDIELQQSVKDIEEIIN